MQKAPTLPDEKRRLEILREYRVLDTAAEKVFDDITSLAAEVCKAPVCLLSFVDTDRLWFKSNVGMPIQEAPRESSLCSHAIAGRDIFVVPDARADERFSDHPIVNGPASVRFYAGMPLITPEGAAVGTLCIIDRVPRQLTDQQVQKLKALAASAVMLLELRRVHPGPSTVSAR
jgi:GAF domain-containing protein